MSILLATLPKVPRKQYNFPTKQQEVSDFNDRLFPPSHKYYLHVNSKIICTKNNQNYDNEN